LRFAARHSRLVRSVVIAGAAAALGFLYALRLDEGRKKHLKKQLSEAREMPRRLLT